MAKRFTEVLRRASEPTWSQAVQHCFVTELFAGTIPDRVMAGYLIQDHRFLDDSAARRGHRHRRQLRGAAALRPLRRHGVGR